MNSQIDEDACGKGDVRLRWGKEYFSSKLYDSRGDMCHSCHA